MRRILIASGAVIGILAAATLLFLNLGLWLSADDPRQPVDVIVVPSGDPNRRLPAAAELVRDGLAPVLWVTIERGGPVFNERRAIAEFAEARGLDVTILGTSRSLRDDARLVAEEIVDRGLRDPVVAVVTSPWNATRARITFQRVLGDRGRVVAWTDATPYAAARRWRAEPETTAVESFKLLGTLALFGARPIEPAEEVPLALPLRSLVGAFLAATVAGFAIRPVARRLGLVARPRLWRAGSAAVPMLGGVAILAGLGVGVLAGGGLSIGPAGAVAAVGVVVLALVGFVDDLTGLGPWTRLLWSAVAGAASWLLGLRAVVLTGTGVTDDAVNLAITALWFVGITHAINVLDNMDGSASGVGAVSAATIAVVAILSGQWVVAVSAAALAGACMGYLVHNVAPARLYMGDLGALAVGFALAALALALRPPQTPPLSFAVAVFALGVPIFDTALVTVSRVRDGRPVALGGTDHTAHRLRARGASVRGSAGVMWGAQAVLGAAAVAVAIGTPIGAWVVVAVVAIAGTGALLVTLRMPVWRPPQTIESSRDLLPFVEDSVKSLRRLTNAAGNELAGSDPTAVRLAVEALSRLERTRDALRDERS